MKRIAIIGAGPGGYYAAICLAKSGCQVTLIEKEYVGGTCLNIGCIPSKTLLDHISLFEHFQESGRKRKIFLTDGIKISPEGLRTFQLQVIKELGSGLEKLFKKRHIELVLGEAKLLSDRIVQVQGKDKNTKLETDEIIIASGSKPNNIPGFSFDKELIVSSDDIWNIPVVPGKLLVIGSGPIGIEFARVFHALGSKVTLSEIKERVCPILDFETSENLARSLKRRGILLKPNTASKFLSIENNLVKIQFLSTQNSDRETDDFDQVLIAVGRIPNTNNLGLENAGVEIEPAGFIRVNQCLQTNKKNIWAIGDVTNYPQLAHTASFQARVVSENILGRRKVFRSDLIPSCIFGYPEIAFVGANEDELKEKNVNYKIGRSLFLASGKAKASGLTEGFVKILMDENTKKILGAHIMGPEASNLIHELVVCMQNEISVDKITESVHAHPTYSEVVLEALEDCLGEAIHI